MKQKNFFAINVFFVLSVLPMLLFSVLPVKALYNREEDVFFLNLIWLSTTMLSIGVLLSGDRLLRTVLYPRKAMSKRQFQKLFLFVGGISLIGVTFIIIDRIFVRGLDYSQGFRAARYAWLNSTLEGKGGSFFSVVGNLSVPFSYCTLFLALYHWESLKIIYKLLGIVSGYGVQFIMAMLNGGRSQILIMLIYTGTVFVMRKASGKKFIPHFKHKQLMNVAVLVACIGILVYMKAIFFAFEKNTFVATDNLLQSLGGTFTDSYRKSGGNDFLNLVIDIVAYLFHGQWMTGMMMEYPINKRIGSSTFYIFLHYLEKLHIVSNAVDRTIASSVFLTLQGSLFYDFGYIGVIGGGVAFGSLFGYAVKMIDKSVKMLSCIQVLFIITVFAIMFGAPITPIYGLGGYVFIIYAMILMDILTRILYGRVSWTYIRED